MSQLTKNFKIEDFSCKHCGANEIKYELVIALQKLRDLCGKPIVITSGYRCKKHPIELYNKRTGQHVLGNAADIVIHLCSLKEMYILVQQIPEFRNGGIGIYPDMGVIHVDIRPEYARWGEVNGEYVSFEKAFKLLG